MKPQKPITYAEQEVLNGKSHQEIYDHIVATSQFNIHDVANMVRKIPTLEKRKKYNLLNAILLGIIAISILDRTILTFSQISAMKLFSVEIVFLFPITVITIISFLFLTISILLFYGVYKYKRNVHLATGFLMFFDSLASIIRLIIQPNLFTFFNLLITALGIFIAFYLSVKLVNDYTIDKELQKSNPNQREGLITFIE